MSEAEGDFAHAETDFTQAIELKTVVADAYAYRRLVRLLRGNEREAGGFHQMPVVRQDSEGVSSSNRSATKQQLAGGNP